MKKVFHEVAGVKIVDWNQYNKAPKHVHKISIKWVTETDQLYNMVDILEKMFDNSHVFKRKGGLFECTKILPNILKNQNHQHGKANNILVQKIKDKQKRE